MPLPSFVKRVLCACLVLLPLAAASVEEADLKTQALDLYSDIKATEEAAFQDTRSVALYFGNREPDLIVRAIQVTVDGREVARYTYSDLEIESIRNGGIHLLADLRLPIGRYAIGVKATAMSVEGGPHAERLYPYIEETFALERNTQWELALVHDAWFKWQNKAAIKVQERGIKNSVSDSLRLKAMYFNAERHQAFEALADALAVLKAGGRADQFSPSLTQALNRSAYEFGLVDIPATLKPVLHNDQARQSPQISPVYSQYNAGVELLKRGEWAQGVQTLMALSAGEYVEYDELLLRDKINLALGFHFLKQGDSELSAKYFRLVRRLSPYANKALVGLGWALLSPRQNRVPAPVDALGAAAPSTAYLWSGSEDEIAWARRHTPFRRAWAVASGGKAEDLQAALVPWMELMNRDPLDPAVQEGLLILPYAMSHWAGQAQRADSYYALATSRLAEALQRLNSASADVQRGGLRNAIDLADQRESSGWNIWLSTIYDSKDGYLDLLLEGSAFYRALQDYRQIARIYHVLSGYKDSAVVAANDGALGGKLSDLLPRLALNVARSAEIIDRIALAELSRHRKRTETYLAEANFALARNHENARRSLTRVVWDGEERQ